MQMFWTRRWKCGQERELSSESSFPPINNRSSGAVTTDTWSEMGPRKETKSAAGIVDTRLLYIFTLVSGLVWPWLICLKLFPSFVLLEPHVYYTVRCLDLISLSSTKKNDCGLLQTRADRFLFKLPTHLRDQLLNFILVKHRSDLMEGTELKKIIKHDS